METGFISEHYLEGGNATTLMFPVDNLGEAIDSERFLLLGGVLYGTESPESFLGQWSIPGEITYFDGWNASIFLHPQEMAGGGTNKLYPVIVSQALYDLFELQPESLLKIGVQSNESKVRFST